MSTIRGGPPSWRRRGASSEDRVGRLATHSPARPRAGKEKPRQTAAQPRSSSFRAAMLPSPPPALLPKPKRKDE
eukprot:scaffold187980_cov28-Tisochrysis_lutea.AAC.1